jgi:trimeric autotransporter adhesin
LARFSLADAADADLAERAAGGDNSAFEELYRRHADAAWRVAHAVTQHRDDAADAVSDAFTRVLAALPAGRLREGGSFRAYLLTATRRAGIDQLRRRGRQQPGDESVFADRPSSETPTEKLMAATDSALVAAAFRGLPERWRSVLWLTEVEGVPAKEAAPLLGMSPNGVAQLAVRARNGLRERYLQAHLSTSEVATECRFTVDHLGAYVAGALSPRDLAKVDQHLAGCAGCREREAELEDLGHRLRKIVLPLPIGLGAVALKQWRFAGGHSLAGNVVGKAAGWAAKAERPLAVASAALFAAGLAGLSLVGGPGPVNADTPSGLAAPRGDAPLTRGTAPVIATTESTTQSWRIGGGSASSGAEDLSSERRHSASNDTPPGDLQNDVEYPDQDGPPPVIPPTPPPPPPAKTPVAQLQITVSGPVSGSVAAGQGDGACTGGSLSGESAGCTPPPSGDDSVVSVVTSGSAVPGQQIGLP